MTSQLDLFEQRPDQHETEPFAPPVASTDPSTLADEALLADLPYARLSGLPAMIAEAVARRRPGTVPALEALARRFMGFSRNRIIPEQAISLDALVAFGGREAAQAVTQLITQSVIEGPSLPAAVSAAAKLQARLPPDALDPLLRHDLPEIRATACACATPRSAPLLIELLADLHPQVASAAACALGRLGRPEARPMLKRLLAQFPTSEVIEALGPIADEEALVLLGRVARRCPHLKGAVLTALESADSPAAATIIASLAKSQM
jgi:HEAT repeats